MSHLLVTNDYPPKIGGIQSYLFELWRRIDPHRVVVLTSADEHAEDFDAQAPHEIVRVKSRVLLPTPRLRARIRSLAKKHGASLVVLDPTLPVGLLGPFLGLPYAVVLHGAEVTVPARIPLLRFVLRRVLSRADLLIAAGSYPAHEATRLLGARHPNLVRIPPGVDVERFSPPSSTERGDLRRSWSLESDALVVVSVSRLVPRKGMDVLIEAAAALKAEYPNLRVLIGGTGRDEKRLGELIAKLGAPVRLVGRVSEDALPGLYQAADVFAMLCRTRWLGLEQEGFGIVFLEAAAGGVAQVAGRSGGADEAVVDGVTGLVVDRPGDLVVATQALRSLLGDEVLRERLGVSARERVEASFTYDSLASALGDALAQAGG